MKIALSRQWSFLDYITVLKPVETSLLAFIGIFSTIVAAGGYPPTRVLVIVLIALILGSAGSNGLTNYLDREVDARMSRTSNRALPSKRIDPPQKALPLIIGLIVVGLVLAWILHPFCFLFGLIGVIASSVWRKTISCTFLGIVAGCSPVLIGWFAISPTFNITILLLCGLVAIWTPIHVWTVMIANRDDYLSAGLRYFPLSWPVKDVVKILFGLSILLYIVSILLYVAADFHLLYLIVANILSILMIYANARLLFSMKSTAAWQVYKLSAFPYLGIIFLTMGIDIWLT
ncbi:MAG: protoheme IX farnesyltransferase [Dehalococcoidia bacterium]|nr:protoheme IX farnesyltransferase [Dehalococcoidia bacterium]